MVSYLFGETILISFQECANRRQTNFFIVELGFEIIGLRELIVHIILHSGDFFSGLCHLLMDPALEVLHFFQIIVDGLLLNLEPSSGGLRVIKLPLLELEIILHFCDLRRRRQLVLPSHILLHVLQQSRDKSLVLLDLLLVLGFLHLELLSELVDLLLLLIEDFVLLLFAALSILFS